MLIHQIKGQIRQRVEVMHVYFVKSREGKCSAYGGNRTLISDHVDRVHPS